MNSLKEMKALARERGGQCLSSQYISSTHKLLWKCGTCGHQWLARPSHVVKGSWCPLCGRKKSDLSRRRHTIEELDELAQSKGGKCLSSRYEGLKKPLLWKCSKNHQWEAQPGSILSGTWCPICNGQPIYTIEDMKELAKSRGGKCLSKKYINGQAKLTWECAVGHVWSAVPASVISGRWCPECSRGFGERICRSFFEQKFKYSFPNIRPKWLLDERSRPMELDGYCEELRLAFEHHGMQHYQVVKWHLSPNSTKLSATQDRDKLRQELCEKAGVRLIVIPSIGSITPLEQLEEFITAELKRQNVQLPKSYSEIHVDYSVAYKKARISSQLNKCKEFAKSKGGECLSTEYVTARQKLKWKCAKGHEWLASTDNVIRGETWCPECKYDVISKALSHSIETMSKIATKHGGKCLSTKYKNAKSILQWQCAKGHAWSSAAGNILSGTWCPECAGHTRLTLQSMQSLAKSRKGKCLSTEYKNVNSALKWECEKGHVWEAIPSNIKKGSWCPQCAIEMRKETRKIVH